VRARVLPLIRAELNPSVDANLSNSAEIARAEEEYWRDQVTRLLPMFVVPGEPARGGGRKQTSSRSVSLDIARLLQQPLALQRRLLRAAAEQLGCNLDFLHVQNILDLLADRNAHGAQGRTVEIEKGWRARLLFRELRLEQAGFKPQFAEYEHRISVPGDAYIPELGSTIRVRITDANDNGPVIAYNRAHLVHVSTASELIIRNWRPGDRYRGALNSSEKPLKELLYPLHLASEIKQLWPVVAAGKQLLWVRGLEPPQLRDADGRQIWIEETQD
jgi:tRNA(Ile)-lysidine synthase